MGKKKNLVVRFVNGNGLEIIFFIEKFTIKFS